MLDGGSEFGSYGLRLDNEKLRLLECSFLVVRDERRIRIIGIRCWLRLDVCCCGGTLNSGECRYNRTVCIVNLCNLVSLFFHIKDEVP